MFNRGKRNEDEDDDLGSLRGGLIDDGEDDGDVGFLDDVAPERASRAETPSERAARVPHQARPRRVNTGRVGLAGGFFRVIGIALVSLIIFLLIGFGIAFAARSIGAIEMVDLATVALPEVQLPEIALFSTPLPSSTPTDLPPTPLPSVTPLGFVAPTQTPDIVCLEMASWWEDHTPIYEWFAAQSVDSPPPSIPATLEQMRIRRETVASTLNAPCIDDARNDFVAGYDHMISAFQLLDSGDLNGARSFVSMAAQAFADGFVAVWNTDVPTMDSPLGVGVAAGSGADCGASAWYDAARSQRSTFFNNYLAIDADTMSGSTIRQHQNVMIAAIDTIRALTVPSCATIPARDLISYMDSLNLALQAQLGNRGDKQQIEAEYLNSAWLSEIQLDAWLHFLGIAA